MNLLNEQLAATHAKKKGLLTVLGYPHVPLHNNEAETDVRELPHSDRYADISARHEDFPRFTEMQKREAVGYFLDSLVADLGKEATPSLAKRRAELQEWLLDPVKREAA